MSKESSSFFGYRQLGDCRPHADIIVYYSGATTDKPLVEGGTLSFLGGVSNVTGLGIGVNSRGAGPFRLDFFSIKPGDAGVRNRCITTNLKQKIRFYIKREAGCQGNVTNIVTLELQPIDVCGKAYEFDEELPLHLFRRCSTMETDCQIVEELARQFNRNYSHLGVASTGMEGSVYFLDIETLIEGHTFRILTHEGLSKPRVIVPGYNRSFTRKLVQDWFNTKAGAPVIYSGTDANLSAVEIYCTVNVPTSFTGHATSNLNQTDTTTTTPQGKIVTVLFEDNTNANAAKAELIAKLKGPGSGNGAAPYISRIIDDSCADSVNYPFTIVREDAGDLAAYTAIKTDYPTTKYYFRAGYIAGKSYYEVYQASATAPSLPSGNTTDVITKGNNQVPAPYTVSSCPPGTACADCPPASPAPL